MVCKAQLGRRLLSAIALCASSGRAQTTDPDPSRIEEIRIDYAAPAGCPNFERFFGWVRERAPSARLAGENQQVRLFSVSFAEQANTSIGRLTVYEPTKTTETREVSAATCEETAAALALIIAVAVDPSSMHRAIATAPEPQPTDAGPQVPPAVVEPAQPPAQTGRFDAGAQPETPAPSEPWRWLITVGAEATGGPAPQFTPALRLSAAARLFSGVAPTVRVSVARGVDRTVAADDGREAELTWTAGRVEGCVVWPLRALELEPCVGVEGGVLRAEGTTGVTEPKSETRPWWATLAGARARLLPSEYLTLELGGGVLVPLQRDDFVLRPDTAVHTPPPVAAFFALGAGVRFQ